jgi:quinol monooxygenase YgiN
LGDNVGMDQPVTVLLTGRVGLFVRLPGLPGSRPALLDALHTYADRLAEEPGTELFVVSVDPGDPDVVWLNEWFRDDEALEAHRAAPAFADLLTTMPELLSGPAGILRIDPLRLDLAGAIAAGHQIDGLPS